MLVDYFVNVGRYIKVKSWDYVEKEQQSIQICSNDVDCKNHFSNKDLKEFKFCPECGSKVISTTIEVKTTKHIYLDSICQELFGNCDYFDVNYTNIFFNGNTVYSKSCFGDCEFGLTNMFEYMKNKTEDDAVDILSKYLSKIGVENEIKFGVVGYYC